MTPDDPRHGTRRGYYAHRRDNEDACDPCKRAAAAAEARYKMLHDRGVPGRLSPIGTQRRLRALVAMGYTWKALDAHVGNRMAEKFGNPPLKYVFPATYIKVRDAYEQLSMTPPPQETTAQRAAVTKAKNLARRKGWPPPMAWDDIDNPNEVPAATYRPVKNWPAEELLAEWSYLRDAGVSDHHAAMQLGVTVDALERAALRQRQDGAA